MPRVRFVIALLFAAVFVLSAANADDASFMFRATARQPYTPAYLRNGVISLVSTPLGTEPAHTFLTGVYDHSPHDVMRLASAPAWNEVDINNGSHWLNALGAGAAVQEYSQRLDMYSLV